MGKDEQENGLMLLCLSTADHFVQLERKRKQDWRPLESSEVVQP